MFVVDVSKSMGTQQTIELSEGRTKKMSRLEHGLRFVKLKIQEMVCRTGCEHCRRLNSMQLYRFTMVVRLINVPSFCLARKVRLHLHWKVSNYIAKLNHKLDTNNILNETNGEYESVSEYVPIGQPNAGTLAKLDALEASPDTSGDRT